jgi:dihydrofolate reductase
MGSVLLDMAISLDGFVAGPNGEDRGLYDWYFAPSAPSTVVKDELLHSIGAMILGRRAFGDQPDGFDTPYKVPHFVLSHTARETVAREGVVFSFVTDGIEQALAHAKAAAGEKVVCVAGGAQTAQQFLNAGLLDELQLHLVPVLLGAGLQLFDHTGGKSLQLERTRVIEGAGVTHLRFRFITEPVVG